MKLLIDIPQTMIDELRDGCFGIKHNVYELAGLIMDGTVLEQEPKTDTWSIKEVADALERHGFGRLEQEPKTGHWIKENPPIVERYPFCSECGFVNPFEDTLNYCPNCGAKMEVSE